MNSSIQIDGKYEIGRELGGGLTGTIYEAFSLVQDFSCAIKFIDESVVPESSWKAKSVLFRDLMSFHNEGHTQILGFGNHDGKMYVIMERVNGCKSLFEMVGKRGALEPVAAAGFICRIAETLTAASEQGLVHLDLCPKNVLVSQTGDVKLINFAIPFGQAGQLQGIPEYISPEAIGRSPLSQQSNIYSLGAVFYFLLTGVPPYTGNGEELFAKHLGGNAVTPSTRNSNVPSALDLVIKKALAPNLEKRYQTVRQMISDISDVFPDELIATQPMEFPLADAIENKETMFGVSAPIVVPPKTEQGKVASQEKPKESTKAAARQRTIAPEKPAPKSVPKPARGKRKTSQSAASGRSRRKSRRSFRETLWFKKGHMDGKAAEKAAHDYARGRSGIEKIDLLPVEDRYADDGSITTKDEKRFSLRTGNTDVTQAIGAERGQGTMPASTSEAMVPEAMMIDEMKAGRGKVIAVVAIAIFLFVAILALVASGGEDPETSPNTQTIETIRQ